MEFKRIHTHEEFLESKQKLHEACMKANAEMSQAEMLEMLDNAKRRREEDPDYMRREFEEWTQRQRKKSSENGLMQRPFEFPTC